MLGPAWDLRFTTASGLCQGSRSAAQDSAGPDPGSAPGNRASVPEVWEQLWRLCQREPAALLGVLSGSGLCQKEPGTSTGVLGSCPGSGTCPAGVGVTGSRGLREGWAALSQSVLAACARCEMSERREETIMMLLQGKRIGLFKGGVCLCTVCDLSCS